jgi:hypothetical protein
MSKLSKIGLKNFVCQFDDFRVTGRLSAPDISLQHNRFSDCYQRQGKTTFASVEPIVARGFAGEPAPKSQ